ncbi:hypothetical protein [Streptomyces sp. NPDC057580]|uniref:hypothetical protein n=1 Tax=Streptomyces sp. NPDC057580 TaxID=3346173 RepID=UPI00367AD2D9
MPSWIPPWRGFTVLLSAVDWATISAGLWAGLGGPDQAVGAVLVGTSTPGVQAASASGMPAIWAG